MAKATDTRPGTAKDRALEYVKTQVLTGAFPGGELISEGDVATALGMSRTPVREAFLRLEAEGLLRLYPQRGALVVPVSPDEVRAVIEARLVLEQFAADQGGGTWPRRLRRGVRAAIGRAATAARRRRHERLARISRRRPRLPRHHPGRVGERHIVRFLLITAGPSDADDRRIGAARSPSGDDDHGRASRIAEALRDGDLQRALQAVQTHLASTVRAIGVAVDLI